MQILYIKGFAYQKLKQRIHKNGPLLVEAHFKNPSTPDTKISHIVQAV